MVTDPIADMLTRIRNAQLARHRRVDMPTSKLKVEVARLLKQNHYIHDYKLLGDGEHPVLRLYLKYFQDKPVIRELRRVSKPGLRQYVGVDDIPRVRNGLGMALLSTSRGVLTDREARAAKVGGELLAIVW
jgi:small subunit ribosomal protein S8